MINLILLIQIEIKRIKYIYKRYVKLFAALFYL